jgi:hypothetical protein
VALVTDEAGNRFDETAVNPVYIDAIAWDRGADAGQAPSGEMLLANLRFLTYAYTCCHAKAFWAACDIALRCRRESVQARQHEDGGRRQHHGWTNFARLGVPGQQ